MNTRAILLLASFAAGLNGAQLRSDWNVRDHIPLDRIIVQSHRGAGELLPENSVEAFEYAWRLGTIPEADLRTTRDGVIVAFHDNDFSRILPSAGPERKKQGIQDLTWEEIARLDVGAWRGAKFAGQRVSRLQDICRMLAQDRGRRMYMDVKDVDLGRLARETQAAGVSARLILASTDYRILLRWKELAPESSSLMWMGGTEEALAKRLAEFRSTKFKSITQLQIHVWSKDGGITPSPGFLLRTGGELRSHGVLFQVFPWHSKDPALFQKLLDLGVASFATDYPEATMKAIADYYRERR